MNAIRVAVAVTAVVESMAAVLHAFVPPGPGAALLVASLVAGPLLGLNACRGDR